MSLLAPRPIRLTAATIRLPTPPLGCCCTHTQFATRHFPLPSVTVSITLLCCKVLHCTSHPLQCTLPWRGSVWTCSKATGSLLHNFLSPRQHFALQHSLEKGMARANRGGGVSRLQLSTCLDLVFADLHVSSLVERKAYMTANNGCASNLVHVLWFQRGADGVCNPHRWAATTQAK